MGSGIAIAAIALAIVLTCMAILRLETRLDDLDERLRTLANEVFKRE